MSRDLESKFSGGGPVTAAVPRLKMLECHGTSNESLTSFVQPKNRTRTWNSRLFTIAYFFAMQD